MHVFFASVIDFTSPYHALCSFYCFGFGLNSVPGKYKLSTTTRKETREIISRVELLGVLFGGLDELCSSLKIRHGFLSFFHLQNFSVLAIKNWIWIRIQWIGIRSTGSLNGLPL
jgi:hypothetical protein